MGLVSSKERDFLLIWIRSNFLRKLKSMSLHRLSKLLNFAVLPPYLKKSRFHLNSTQFFSVSEFWTILYIRGQQHASLQPLCSGSLYSVGNIHIVRERWTEQISFHMMNIHVHFLNHRIRPPCEVPEGRENVYELPDSTHTHTGPGLCPPTLAQSKTCSEIRARSREAASQWLCWRTVETGLSCSVIRAEAAAGL